MRITAVEPILLRGAQAYGAFFLFMQWTRMGEQGVAGHLESDSLTWGADRESATQALGTWPIERVQALLEDLIRARRATATDADAAGANA